MASEPIRSTAIEAAPKDYSIPNAQQIRLLSVTAQFIDNGAAGDWLPAVVILDNNGNALCRAVDQAVKVTAGNDAEVSWFPGVKNMAAATAASALDWTWGVRNAAIFGDSPFACPANAVTDHPFPHTFGNLKGTFSWVTDVNANDTLALNKTGLYLVIGAAQWSASGVVVRAALSNPDTTLSLHGDTAANTITAGNLGGMGVLWTIDDSMLMIGNAPTDTRLGLFQQTAGPINVTNASLGAFYFGDT